MEKETNKQKTIFAVCRLYVNRILPLSLIINNTRFRIIFNLFLLFPAVIDNLHIEAQL